MRKRASKWENKLVNVKISLASKCENKLVNEKISL